LDALTSAGSVGHGLACLAINVDRLRKLLLRLTTVVESVRKRFLLLSGRVSGQGVGLVLTVAGPWRSYCSCVLVCKGEGRDVRVALADQFGLRALTGLFLDDTHDRGRVVGEQGPVGGEEGGQLVALELLTQRAVLPCSSTPCTWNTFFARLMPTVASFIWTLLFVLFKWLQ